MTHHHITTCIESGTLAKCIESVTALPLVPSSFAPLRRRDGYDAEVLRGGGADEERQHGARSARRPAAGAAKAERGLVGEVCKFGKRRFSESSRRNPCMITRVKISTQALTPLCLSAQRETKNEIVSLLMTFGVEISEECHLLGVSAK